MYNTLIIRCIVSPQFAFKRDYRPMVAQVCTACCHNYFCINIASRDLVKNATNKSNLFVNISLHQLRGKVQVFVGTQRS